jgi:precorrin-2 dehydrogenase / sirohydrochlorin ferrochelatase
MDYPVSLNIAGCLCVVVGGGPVGLRKARGLLEAGARVRLITRTHPGQEKTTGMEVLVRPYRTGDLAGAALAFAAAGERAVNATVALDARAAGIPVNMADAPAEGDFHLPAVLRRGELVIAVSTGGGSPALAAAVRDELAGIFGEEWATVVAIAARLRQKHLTPEGKNEYNPQVLQGLLADGRLPVLVRVRDETGIEALLKSVLGESCTLAELGIRLPPKG